MEYAKRALTLWEGGMGIREIADSLSVKEETISRYLRSAPKSEEPVIHIDLPPEALAETPEDLWNAVKSCSATPQKVAHNNKAKITIETDSPIGLVFLTDQHLGSAKADMARMEHDAKVIAETPGLYAVLGGDLIDNFIFGGKMLSTVLDAEVRIEKQWALAEHYLSMFGDKILAIVAGNHDNWTKRVAGIDYLHKLARKKRVLYDPHEWQLKFKVGKVMYNILLRHQARFNSSYNLTHVCKQLLRMGRYKDIPDVVVLGHHHTAALEYWIWGGRPRLAIRTGSYKLEDEFAVAHAFDTTQLHMAPTAVLYPDKFEMLGLPDIDTAAEFITAFQKK